MEKIKEIDYFRGLATIFVILIHITSSYLTYPKDSLTYNFFGSFNCALTFAVPAFLFISALVMTYQVKNKQKLKWIPFISKRIFKVLSALILWSVIYTLYWGNYENISIKNILDYFTLGSASYHLYFIPLIIQLYLLFPLIWEIIKLVSKIKINTILSFLICITVVAIIQYMFTIVFRLNLFKTYAYFSTIIFSYTLPIAVGIWIGFNYDNVKKFFNDFFIISITILSSICCYYYVKFEFINYTYKTTLLFSPFYWTMIILTLTYLLRLIKNSTILEKISKNSFIIYLSHPLILDIFNTKLKWPNFSFFSGAFINYFFNTSLKFLIVLSLSYLLAFIYLKLKFKLFKN